MADRETGIDEILSEAGDLYKRHFFGEALKKAGTALDLDSENPDAYGIAGDCLLALGQLESAERIYSLLLRSEPSNPNLRFKLGRCLSGAGRLDDACRVLGDLAGQTDTAGVHIEYCRVLLQLGRLEEAGTEASKAIAVDPESSLGYAALGSANYYMGRFEDAEHHFRRSIRLDPSNSEARYSLGMICLSKKNFEEGWRQYAFRNAILDLQRPSSLLDIPQFAENCPPGSEVLFYEEQGLGDTLQFIRYSMRLVELGFKVKCRFQAPLSSLLKRSFPGMEMVQTVSPIPKADYRLSLFEAMEKLDPQLLCVPFAKGYLVAPSDCPEEIDSILSKKSGEFRVGLVWQGNQDNYFGLHRSCPLMALEPLVKLPGVEFFSLQYGEAEKELAKHSFANRITPLGNMLRDFDILAFTMKKMDLIVTVDTAAAHMAGGLGVPTWILLSSPPDWRWFLEGDRSVWYDSVKLYRMNSRGMWAELMSRVATDLARVVISKDPI